MGLTSFAPTVKLKRSVQGVDDYRYLYMLDHLIKKAARSKNAAAKATAKEARAWLDAKLKSIPDGIERYHGHIDWYGEVHDGVSWYGDDFDKYRWRMAEFIMALRKELGER